jgi:hypothetical protein
VETRFFWKRNDTDWEHATYLWDATGKHATLSLSKMPTLLESGYEIPSAVKVCDKCHGGAADQLLGLEPVSPALGTAATDTCRTGVNQDVLLPKYVQAYPGTKVITPGAHEQSLTWQLAHFRGLGQMPPIVSHKVDEVGTGKLADWIDALGK